MMGELTGRKVLWMFVGFFGVIITVNLVMAFFAVRTFSGLEVANSYDASQGYDEAREAQLALGWDVSAEYGEGEIAVILRDAETGAPAAVTDLTALVGRATHQRADFTPDFERRGARFAAPATLDPGNWVVRLRATASDGTVFRQRLPLVVPR
ncbi:FixH family protein [Meridianimarinicoccus sp. RP-17]|uniref:FixH family protein n=1 Tax=Meridianimarinicoccus zhengii TaxID=2056810 RepID=UPI002E2718CA